MASKVKPKTELEWKIFRVIINSWPQRSPDGQLKAIMELRKEEEDSLKAKIQELPNNYEYEEHFGYETCRFDVLALLEEENKKRK